MTSRVVVDDDEQIIADLMREVRRLSSRHTTTSVRGWHDEFTAAATPATDYPLTYLPDDGTCELALNGEVLKEGTDYTCDYDTGLVAVTATQVAGDHLTFRYLITDYLVAASLPEDTIPPIGFTGVNTGRPINVASLSSGSSSAAGDGDWIVQWVMYPNAMTWAIDSPSGWSQLQKTVGTSITTELWVRQWHTGDPTSWSVTVTGFHANTVQDRSITLVFSGLASAPSIVAAAKEVSSSPAQTNSITNGAISAADWQVALIGSYPNGINTASTTPASSTWTQVSGSAPGTAAAAYRTVDSAGAAVAWSAPVVSGGSITDAIGTQLILPGAM